MLPDSRLSVRLPKGSRSSRIIIKLLSPLGDGHHATTTHHRSSSPVIIAAASHGLTPGLPASDYTMAIPQYLSLSSPAAAALPVWARCLARGSSLAGPPHGTSAVAWCACCKRDTMFGRHQSNGKIGFVTIRALSKEGSLSSFLLSLCLSLLPLLIFLCLFRGRATA